MARGINVKVSKAKVVKALKDKLDASAKAIVSNEKKRKEHEKTKKAWSKEVAEIVIKQISKADVSASENWRNEIRVDVTIPAGLVTLPTEPKIELEQELGRYEVQEIENAIRILEMSDEEFVSASTMKQIASYL
jgi:hypothetical protein